MRNPQVCQWIMETFCIMFCKYLYDYTATKQKKYSVHSFFYHELFNFVRIYDASCITLSSVDSQKMQLFKRIKRLELKIYLKYFCYIYTFISVTLRIYKINLQNL